MTAPIELAREIVGIIYWWYVFGVVLVALNLFVAFICLMCWRAQGRLIFAQLIPIPLIAALMILLILATGP